MSAEKPPSCGRRQQSGRCRVPTAAFAFAWKPPPLSLGGGGLPGGFQGASSCSARSGCRWKTSDEWHLYGTGPRPTGRLQS